MSTQHPSAADAHGRAAPRDPFPPYRAPAWLPGRHGQTLWTALMARAPEVCWRRVRWDTPDGDFIDVDFVLPADGQAPLPDADPRDARPLLIHFHGLEGSRDSIYARALMAAVRDRGWRGAVVHFRGCSGELNRLPRTYHSGDSDEIDWVLRRFARDHARAADLYAVGVSLGGNALLKWLGERGEDAGRIVRAAAAVSAPQDLHAGAVALSKGFSLLYCANFLKTLKAKSLAKLALHPGIFDGERVRTARTFFDFDDAVTAPLHGFRDCHDYWARSSSRQFLGGVTAPVLVLNALNDPFVPGHALARPDQVSSSVRLEYPASGGHVGFIGSGFPGRHDWLPARLLHFLEHG